MIDLLYEKHFALGPYLPTCKRKDAPSLLPAQPQAVFQEQQYFYILIFIFLLNANEDIPWIVPD